MRVEQHDGIDQRRVRSSQPDPLIMYLVASRRPSVPGGELLSQAALAAVLCVREFESDPIWAGAFAEWEDSSFHKVCLRARPAELERARTLPHSESGEVLCFPPRRRSVAEPELSRLQAHIGGPLEASDVAYPETEPSAMVLLITEELQLTIGKGVCAGRSRSVDRATAAQTDLGERVGTPRLPDRGRARRSEVL